MTEREVVRGWCIRFGGDGLPLLEECSVERLNESQYIRSRVQGGYDAVQPTDFFTSKQAALLRLRDHLVLSGEEHRLAVEYINRRVIEIDMELEGLRNG